MTQAVALRAGASLRRRGGERKGAPATQPDGCPALSDLHHLRRQLVAGQGLTWHHQPAGSDRAHFLPAPQPRASRGHVGERSHAATSPGRGESLCNRPGSRLAKRARRAVPDPQHGLASTQRDLLQPCGEILGLLRVNERLHPAEVCGTSQVRRAVRRGQVH